MNKNYLIRVFGVGLLGLLTGAIPLGAKPAAAETADASTLQKLAETLEADNDDRTLAETADDSVSVAPTPTETIGSNEAGTNLNTSAAELGKADSSSLSSTSRAQDLPSSESVTGMAAPTTGDEQLGGEESFESAIANRQSPTTTDTDATEELAQSNSDQLEPLTNVSDLIDEQPSDRMEQVTNVSQLRDVQPSDWAYEALRSLVERYGCIAGYPDGTFRGNRAMTRYEFAAGLTPRTYQRWAQTMSDFTNCFTSSPLLGDLPCLLARRLKSPMLFLPTFNPKDLLTFNGFSD